MAFISQLALEPPAAGRRGAECRSAALLGVLCVPLREIVVSAYTCLKQGRGSALAF
jgi:hypothetical protein